MTSPFLSSKSYLIVIPRGHNKELFDVQRTRWQPREDNQATNYKILVIAP
jgi:hypothetical protein